MNHCPTEPSIGDKISASRMRELMRYVRSITPMPGRNVRLRRTPNGTFIDGSPAATALSPSSDRGCFAIKSITQQEKEEGETLKFTVEFKNKYVSVGGKTYDLDSLGPIEDVEKDFIVALKISATAEDDAELDKFESIYALQNEQNTKENLYVVPLYKFGEKGRVECDFRNMPLAAMGEF